MYAIMRSKKHKLGGGLNAALQHLYRERETPNADASKIADNLYLEDEFSTHKSLQNLHAEIKRITDDSGRKIRKDAVVAVEYVFTASPEWWDDTKEQRKEFATRTFKWLEETYPDGKIIAGGLHLDETTPHLSVFITPTTTRKSKDGKVLTLNAKSFLGGAQRLSEQQTSYAKAVETMGLKRGVEKSNAKHQQVSRFYGDLVKSENNSRAIAKPLREQLDAANKLIGGKGKIIDIANALINELADVKSSASLAENRSLKVKIESLETEIKQASVSVRQKVEKENEHVLSEYQSAMKHIDDLVKQITKLENKNSEWSSAMMKITGNHEAYKEALIGFDNISMKSSNGNNMGKTSPKNGRIQKI